jgi:hypothetical protein
VALCLRRTRRGGDHPRPSSWRGRCSPASRPGTGSRGGASRGRGGGWFRSRPGPVRMRWQPAAPAQAVRAGMAARPAVGWSAEGRGAGGGATGRQGGGVVGPGAWQHGAGVALTGCRGPQGCQLRAAGARWEALAAIRQRLGGGIEGGGRCDGHRIHAQSGGCGPPLGPIGGAAGVLGGSWG